MIFSHRFGLFFVTRGRRVLYGFWVLSFVFFYLIIQKLVKLLNCKNVTIKIFVV